MKSILKSFIALVFIILAAGCASSNTNPAHARTNTGYVDFYAVNADNLSWDITDTTLNRKVFSEFDPVREPILRLAFKPGRYQLSVTFINHVISLPGAMEVEVRDGMITPVPVTLVDVGAAQVITRQAGRSYFGRYGKHAKISDNQSVSYEVITDPQPPLLYQPKAQMPYIHIADP